MRIRISSLFWGLSFLLGAPFSFGLDWKAYSAPYPIHDAVASPSGLWLATGGGLRFLDENGQGFVRNAADGMEETPQLAVVRTKSGSIFSVSASGIIAQVPPDGNSVRIVNRSYKESGSMVVSGAVRSYGEYILIPFQDRISLFDGSTGRSVLTWTRVGKKSLGESSIHDVLLRGDTVFLACGDSVYRRRIAFDSLAQILDLPDPEGWVLDAGSAVFQTKSDDVQAGSNGLVRIEGKVRKDDVLCPGGACIPTWVAHESSSRHWLGDSVRIWLLAGSSRKDLSVWSGAPAQNASAVRVAGSGVAVAWMGSEVVTFREEGVARVPYQVLPLFEETRRSVLQPLKTLQVDASGSAHVGTWGAGLVYFSNLLGNPTGVVPQVISPSYGACFDAYDRPVGSDFTFSVVTGVELTPSKQGTLIHYYGEDHGKNPSGVAYVPSSGTDLQCLNRVGSEPYSGPVAMGEDSVSGNWIVFAAQVPDGGESYGVIDRTVVTNPESGLGLSLVSQSQIGVETVGTVRDVAYDSRNRRLWAVGTMGLGFWEDEEGLDSLRPVDQTIGGIPSDLSGVEVDVHGDLWLSSFTRGIYYAKLQNGKPDTLILTTYTNREGLLSNRVYDLALDPAKGEVWFAHDLGVSRLGAIGVRDASSFQKDGSPAVVAYPNPYRPGKHAHVIFEHLSESAQLKVFDAAGTMVRSFDGASIKGGRLLWDGRSHRGNLVAPGLYHWVAVWGKNSQRGRILVIR